MVFIVFYRDTKKIIPQCDLTSNFSNNWLTTMYLSPEYCESIMQMICNKQKNDLNFKGTRIWFANLFVFCLPSLFLFNINESMYTYWLSLTIVWRYLTLEHTGGFLYLGYVLSICYGKCFTVLCQTLSWQLEF